MRIAVFVDAGYLYAQGSIALTRAKKPKPREELDLNIQVLLAKLKELTKEIAPNKGLLRVYWYDGAPPGKLNDHQMKLAMTDDIKLRLGRLHEDGQQKGVDSLIVTDLIELARNRSITDALLISGDEDVRVGVEIAQTHGIRVHLLGIHPANESAIGAAETRSRHAKSVGCGDCQIISGTSRKDKGACEFGSEGRCHKRFARENHASARTACRVIAAGCRDSKTSDRPGRAAASCEGARLYHKKQGSAWVDRVTGLRCSGRSTWPQAKACRK